MEFNNLWVAVNHGVFGTQQGFAYKGIDSQDPDRLLARFLHPASQSQGVGQGDARYVETGVQFDTSLSGANGVFILMQAYVCARQEEEPVGQRRMLGRVVDELGKPEFPF